MAAERADDGTDEPGKGKGLKRRGILAAAGAAVAGILAKQTAQPVLAATVTTGANNNVAQTQTAIINNSNNTSGAALVGYRAMNAVASVVISFDAGVAGYIGNGTGYGVYGRGNYGVVGEGGGVGVFGRSATAGVQGFIPADSTATDQSYGVNGYNSLPRADAYGVLAQANGGPGVHASTSGLYGVYGTSAKAGGVGVAGYVAGGYGLLGTADDGFGVLGQSTTGNGLRGYAAQNHAVVGQTGRAYYGGVFGVATVDNTVGIYGSTFNGATRNANAFAGYMDGNFVVANGVKSAAVPHKDGSHRLVYCMESPESWLEDFGTAKLVGGAAQVKIDADFAAVADMGDYHVFLTPDADCKGFYVTGKGATGFSVRERQGGTSSLGFSYRIVARRKDIKADRLAKFDLVGKAKHDAKPPQSPEPPKLPKQPEQP